MIRPWATALAVAGTTLLSACASGNDGSEREAWASEVNEICRALALEVNDLDPSENRIVLSQQVREVAEIMRLSMVQVASVPRPEGKGDDISRMVRFYNEALDFDEQLADQLLERDDARIDQLVEEGESRKSRADEIAADLGVGCLVGRGAPR